MMSVTGEHVPSVVAEKEAYIVSEANAQKRASPLTICCYLSVYRNKSFVKSDVRRKQVYIYHGRDKETRLESKVAQVTREEKKTEI